MFHLDRPWLIVLLRGMLFFIVLSSVDVRAAEKHDYPRLVISHVTVIDTRTGQLLADTNVIVIGTRIASVDAVTPALSSSDPLIDGKGKYLIPGLWDCHLQLRW